MRTKAILSMIVAAIAGSAPGQAEQTRKAAFLSEREAFDIGVEAYIYGYPLVTMGVTRKVLTNVASPAGTSGAPMNQFSNVRKFLAAGFTGVVAPNNDTLYSQAWLDLSKEPIVLHVPDSKGRYFLMPILSGWTDVVASPGTRTTGTKAGDYAITGPGWKGTLPAGVERIASPTDMVWVIGRTYSTGAPTDLAEVHAFQDGLSLKPLSAYGKSYTAPRGTVHPGVDTGTSPGQQVDRMDAATFFPLLASLMKENPPARADAAMVEKLARIGIVPGHDLDLSKLAPAVVRGLRRAPKAGLERILAHRKDAGVVVNGWTITLKTGEYGTDYLQRAFIAAVGLGANLPQDAVYPLARVDGQGRALNGAYRYVLRFAKGDTPPVRGFWSVTMYNERLFFVDNPINRYAIHSADKLQYNADGSLDLYIQSESPGPERESNWLPAPKGNFALMMRLYWPEDFVLNGSWVPPAVLPVRSGAASPAR